MDCIHKCHPWRHPWARPPHVTRDRGRKNRQSASSSTAPRNAPNSKSTFRHPSPVTSSVPSGERPGHSTVARPGSSPRHTHLQTLGAPHRTAPPPPPKRRQKHVQLTATPTSPTSLPHTPVVCLTLESREPQTRSTLQSRFPLEMGRSRALQVSPPHEPS